MTGSSGEKSAKSVCFRLCGFFLAIHIRWWYNRRVRIFYNVRNLLSRIPEIKRRSAAK